MSDIKILSLLSKYLGESNIYRGSERYYNCPFCHHYKKKFAVNISKGAWHCWVCEASGKKLSSLFYKINASKEDIKEIRELFNDEHYVSYTNDDVEESVSLPPEYTPLYKIQKSFKYKKSISYLKHRGITAQDVLKYNIGHCEYGTYTNRIIFPSYDSDLKLNYFVARSYNDDDMPYLLPHVSKNIIPFENLIHWDSPVILVEGIFDAIALKRNAIPMLGKALQPALRNKLIEMKPKVYVFLDKDAVKSQYKICKELHDNGVDVRWVTSSEKDPSEMGYEKSMKCIEQAIKIEYDVLIKKSLNVNL